MERIKKNCIERVLKYRFNTKTAISSIEYDKIWNAVRSFVFEKFHVSREFLSTLEGGGGVGCGMIILWENGASSDQ